MPWIYSHSLQNNPSLSRSLPSIPQDLGHFSYLNMKRTFTLWEHLERYFWNISFSISHLPHTHLKLKQTTQLSSGFPERLPAILDRSCGSGQSQVWLHEVMAAWESILDVWEEFSASCQSRSIKPLKIYWVCVISEKRISKSWVIQVSSKSLMGLKASRARGTTHIRSE